MQMQDVMEQIKILKGEISKSEIFAHPKFAEPMLEYILNDLKDFRKKDETIGGMVVCDTSEQAKELLPNLKKSTETRV
jgi:type I restriction enzyme R subunit